MAEHNAFYHRLAGRINTVLQTYDALCPKVMSLRPFSDQATDVNPKVGELIIRFDRPMNPKQHSVSFVQSGQERDTPVERVASDKRAFKIKMRLEPNRAYSLTLRRGGFQALDGYLSDEYIVTFKTKP